MAAARRLHAIQIKRAYDPASNEDGYRMLVDRLWPRGLKKEKAQLDEWDKDISPSPALRTWFGHDPARFPEFDQRYRAELAEQPKELARLRALAAKTPLTLVYAAKDPACNHALVLRSVLTRKRTPRTN
jgi:uncharacterized protein YeaO (DUF488 family)